MSPLFVLATASYWHIAQALSPVGVTEVHGGVMLTPIEGLGHDSGPVNCAMAPWGAWETCSKSCGKGETTRKRTIATYAARGGSCTHSLFEGTFCNDHSCDARDLPRCHGEHVHCKVQSKEMNKWVDKLGQDNNKCHTWWTYNYQTATKDSVKRNCHHCDSKVECKMTGTHKTLVVVHDRKYAHLEGQKNMFHCFFGAKNSGQCFCTCSMHPPCVAKVGMRLTNTAIRGNIWHGVATRQTCCNMCTNHPSCASFTYTATGECTFFQGSAVYEAIPAASPDHATTWSGCQSGDLC